VTGFTSIIHTVLVSRVIFETERLIARQWTLDDAEAAFQLYGDKEVVRFLGGMQAITTVEKVREYLAKVLERYATGSMGMWPLIEKSSGELVGAVLLKPLPEHTEIEVGWHLARAHWGKGYATESARRAIEYGFEDLGLQTIYAVVIPENERSIAVTRRLGMESLGRTSEYYGLEVELFRICKER